MCSPRNERAVTRIVEFIIMATVFFVMVSGFFAVMAGKFYLLTVRETADFGELTKITDLLLGTHGMLQNGSTAWEYYDAATLESELLRVGLSNASEKTYAVIDFRKLNALHKIEYTHFLELLTLDKLGWHVNITLYNVTYSDGWTRESAASIAYGTDLRGALAKGAVYEVTRVVLVLADGAETPAVLIVRFAE
jgi:hypothetical protein